MYEIQRIDADIDDLLNKCMESEESGSSKYPGMTFEQGIREAIDWITGQTNEPPIEDD